MLHTTAGVNQLGAGNNASPRPDDATNIWGSPVYMVIFCLPLFYVGLCINMYLYVYIYIHPHIYIYPSKYIYIYIAYLASLWPQKNIERERGRDQLVEPVDMVVLTGIYVGFIYMRVCILYIYIYQLVSQIF